MAYHGLSIFLWGVVFPFQVQYAFSSFSFSGWVFPRTGSWSVFCPFWAFKWRRRRSQKPSISIHESWLQFGDQGKAEAGYAGVCAVTLSQDVPVFLTVYDTFVGGLVPLAAWFVAIQAWYVGFPMFFHVLFCRMLASPCSLFATLHPCPYTSRILEEYVCWNWIVDFLYIFIYHIYIFIWRFNDVTCNVYWTSLLDHISQLCFMRGVFMSAHKRLPG